MPVKTTLGYMMGKAPSPVLPPLVSILRFTSYFRAQHTP